MGFRKLRAGPGPSFVKDGYARYIETLGDEYEQKKAAIRLRLAQANNETELAAIQQAMDELNGDYQKKMAAARRNLY
jgi:hypothetical protein